MTPEWAGYISGVFIFLSFLPYLRDILRGTTKPERGSWLIWAVLGSIAFFSQLAEGASYSLYLAGIQALGDIAVFVLALKYGFGGVEKRDRVALVGAGTSLLLWYFTREPAYALLLVILIDAIGGVLTILKSYEAPSTETLSTWILTGLAGLFAIFSVGSFDVVLLSFPVYIFLINFAIVAAIKLGVRKQRATDEKLS